MTELSVFIISIIVLLIKHFYVDFVFQTRRMVEGKGIFLNLDGILHSLQHTLATMIYLLILAFAFDVPFDIIIFLTFFDGITHYLIDWVKMNVGKAFGWGHEDKEYWMAIGLDQFAHQLVYVLISMIVAYNINQGIFS